MLYVFVWDVKRRYPFTSQYVKYVTIWRHQFFKSTTMTAHLIQCKLWHRCPRPIIAWLEKEVLSLHQTKHKGEALIGWFTLGTRESSGPKWHFPQRQRGPFNRTQMTRVTLNLHDFCHTSRVALVIVTLLFRVTFSPSVIFTKHLSMNIVELWEFYLVLYIYLFELQNRLHDVQAVIRE